MNNKDVMKLCYIKLGFQNLESNQIFKMEESTFSFHRKISYKFIFLENIKIKSKKFKGNFDSKSKDYPIDLIPYVI